MKRYYIIAAVATALLAAGCRHSAKSDSDSEIPAIDVAQVTNDSVMIHQTYPGFLKADKTVDVVARVSGNLTGRNFKEGDMVSKGQVLFTIDPTIYRDRVAQASAQLATARSEYDYASSHYNAVKKALESDAVSQMEVSQAKSAMDQAAAAIESARAALSSAQTNLGYCTVRAPMSGRITASTLSVGNFVGGEGAPVTLATIYDDSKLKAVFNVEDAAHERMLSQMALDNDTVMKTVVLQFEERLPHSYRGTLTYLAPDVNTGTGTLQMRAVVANPYGELRDGMYVDVLVPSEIVSHAMLVKDASLGTDQLGRYLYTVNDSDRVVYTPVKVGELYDDSLRIVTSGITPSTRYVTRALLKVRDGMAIRPVLTK